MPAPSTHPAIVLKRPSMLAQEPFEDALTWRLLYAGGRAGQAARGGGVRREPAVTAAARFAGPTYARYPRYPQAESAWFDSHFS